ncbi:MAG: hypothetical protein EA422_00150, partial [Gemmatimonadales bacterium]
MTTLPFALSVRRERLPEGTPGSEAAADLPGGTPGSDTATDFPAVIRGEIHLPDGGGGDGATADPGSDAHSAVVLVHGFKGFRRWGFFPHLAQRLVEDGHTVVAFDFSLNGVGEGGLDFDELEAFARNTFSRELAELRQVVEALRGGSLPGPVPQRIGLLGHSRGGGIAVLGARELGVDALATWASVATFQRWDEATRRRWKEAGRIHVANARTNQEMPLDVTLLDDVEENGERLDIEGAAAALDVPWLIVHGDGDEAVPVAEAERLSRAAPEAHLEVIAGAGHTFGATHPFSGESEHLGQVLSLTREHFRTAL